MAEILINVPYINQERSTAPGFNGASACGPTSCVMVVAAYGLLEPQPNDVFTNFDKLSGKNVTEQSLYGRYVSQSYFLNGNMAFTKTVMDDSTRPAAGAFGTCVISTDIGSGSGNMANYFSKQSLGSQISHASNPDQVRSIIRQNIPVVIGTYYKGWGHVMVIKGLMEDGRFICNDPFWRKTGAGDDIYSWDDLRIYNFSGGTTYMIVPNRPVPASLAGVDPIGRFNLSAPVVKPVDPTPITVHPVIQPLLARGLSDNQEQRFFLAFRRNGGKEAVGDPTNAPQTIDTPLGKAITQQFSGGSLGDSLIFMDISHDQPQAVPVPSFSAALIISEPFLKKYNEFGGVNGPLGLITSDVFTNQQGKKQVSSQGGYITWDGSGEVDSPFLWPEDSEINGWKAEYFNNPSLAGPDALLRDETDINYKLGPDSNTFRTLGVLGNDFSARWSRTGDFPEGSYRFTVTCDDGFRLYYGHINDDGSVNFTSVTPDPNQFWIVSAAQTHDFDMQLSGKTRIVLEYFQHSEGAVIQINWPLEPPPSA